jgi:uncharacterized LabA/DUF88 family protein
MNPASQQQAKKRERVIVYIDGFNLYFGLRERGWHRYMWLDLKQLSHKLLKSDQKLVATNYFTSRVSSPKDKADRQNTFLEALGTLPKLQIFYGNYQVNKRKCMHCGKIDRVPNEKMTDVNIATEMLTDAFLDKFDTALLISADGDLETPVEKIATTAGKRLVVVFPPSRCSFKLKQKATATMIMGRGHLATSLLPKKITKPDGFILTRPAKWR